MNLCSTPALRAEPDARRGLEFCSPTPQDPPQKSVPKAPAPSSPVPVLDIWSSMLRAELFAE